MIAITGGIAEGKSTILEALRKEGLHVLSADAIVGQLWREPPTLEAIGDMLGMADPTKSKVLQLIQESHESRRALNRFLHPLVYARLMESRAEAIEFPLLIETCMQCAFDHVWVVTCGPEEQVRRLAQRVGEAQAKRLVSLQLPTRAKIPFADEVLRTNMPLSDVHIATRQALTRLMRNRLFR